MKSHEEEGRGDVVGGEGECSSSMKEKGDGVVP